MPTTKIHWRLIFFVFLIVLLAAWTTTQWMAWHPGFQSELELPRFEAPGVFPVYFHLIFFGGGMLSQPAHSRFSSKAAQATAICNAEESKADLISKGASASDIVVQRKMKGT